MLLLEPEPTPADLRFSIFGIPVRVHPMFWLMSAVLGSTLLERGWSYLLLWIVAVFVSILIHELGHVLMGLAFGSRGHIVLFSFGGLAIGSKNLAKRWQRIAVSAAGPLIQFVPLGITMFIDANFDELFGPDFLFTNAGQKVDALLLMLFFINLYWPLLNLLPIWPLDGGQISRELFEAFMGRGGTRMALGISFLVAGLIAVNAIVAMNRGKPLLPYLPTGGWYTVILFGLLALGSYQAMQTPSDADPWGPEGAPWERDRDNWRR